tara:strand:- start:183 stop:404 length:222 start_codon:yes stop_codon:yes gene_type:complete
MGELVSGTEEEVHGLPTKVTVPGGDAYWNATRNGPILPDPADHLSDNPVDGEGAVARNRTLAERTKAAVCALG